MVGNGKTDPASKHSDARESFREMLARKQAYRYRIGDEGEGFVLSQELLKYEGTEYANCIKDCSDDKNSHFDILSCTASGEKLYIEVKSTASNDPYIDFHMSRKELAVAWHCYKKGIRYEIHRVYGVGSDIRRLIIPAEALFRDFETIGQQYALRKKSTAQAQQHLRGNAAVVQ